uniref:Guanylate kinase n=1 Tax=Schlesneria paludicola TaxID=360056 RepID=A0A7C4LN71_9PLAN
MTDAEASFRVVVLSGPSGSGKTTVVDRLLDRAPVKLMKSVSATTRPPRAGERHGERYYFLTPEEFADRRQRGEFVETAEYAGAWYGTLWSEVDRARARGAWPLLEIEVQGALKVMELYPDCVSIFLRPPSMAECEQRLRARNTEDETGIQQRVQTAVAEMQLAPRYRYQVVNDDLERAVDEIALILRKEHAQGTPSGDSDPPC